MSAKEIIDRMVYNTEGDVFTSMEAACLNITQTSDYLRENLKEIQQMCPGIFTRSVEELGLSDMVKVAQGILKLRKQIKEAKG